MSCRRRRRSNRLLQRRRQPNRPGSGSRRDQEREGQIRKDRPTLRRIALFSTLALLQPVFYKQTPVNTQIQGCRVGADADRVPPVSKKIGSESLVSFRTLIEILLTGWLLDGVVLEVLFPFFSDPLPLSSFVQPRFFALRLFLRF